MLIWFRNIKKWSIRNKNCKKIKQHLFVFKNEKWKHNYYDVLMSAALNNKNIKLDT